MDYITREFAVKTIKNLCCSYCNNYNGDRCKDCSINDVIPRIYGEPAADAVPVVHGEWVEMREWEERDNGDEIEDVEYIFYNCSRCGFCVGSDKGWYNYCPGCGAKMDGANAEITEYFDKGAKTMNENEKEAPRGNVIDGENLLTLSADGEEIYITMAEYKRLLAAEIILRVLLASDIGTYGSDNGVIDAAQKVYNEIAGVKEAGENNAE